MEFQRVSPESVGVRSRGVLDLLDRLYRDGIEMHSFMLLRHGKVYAEGSWRPYRPQVPHIMFSFTKSLTSTAIGFAVQEGLLSLDDRLIDLFPDKSPEHPGENLQKATVRHLLMMGCGQETEIRWIEGSGDWITQFLSHDFPHEPGAHFLYNTAGTNLLSAILTRKTGQTLTQFLSPRLFRPLGMSDVSCYALPDGTQAGGFGSSLTIEDMARFMQFVADKGRWEGRQLLNAAWFEEATAKHIENRGAGWGGDPDWQQGYGYQFWRCEPDGVFRGDGAFGQYGVVLPRQDAVVVIQSASCRLQAVLTALWECLLPAMAGAPLPENPADFTELSFRLSRLELTPLFGMRNPGAEASLNGAVYTPVGAAPSLPDLIGGIGRFTPDNARLEQLTFRFEGDDVALLVRQSDGEFPLKIGMNGHFVPTDLSGLPYAACGGWRARNKLEVELRCTRYASGKHFLFTFEGDSLTLTGDSTIPEVGGLADPLTPEVRFTLTQGSVNLKTHQYWEAT